MFDGSDYQPINSSQNLAIIEKIIRGETTAILIHGYDEEHTARAVEYLRLKWHDLYKMYGKGEFAIMVN